MTTNLIDVLNKAHNRSVPLVGISTADQLFTVDTIRTAKPDSYLFRWDAVMGIRPLNDISAKVMGKIGMKPDDTISFVEAMVAAQALPDVSLLMVLGAHRQLSSQEPKETAAAVQAVMNLRDQFKVNHRMLVLLAPIFVPPPELGQDIIALDHALPTSEQLGKLISELYSGVQEQNGLKPLKKETHGKAVDAVSGLSGFAAEQSFSLVVDKDGIDIDALWERKRVAIEQTRGLSVYRGKETFKDLRGLANIKARLLDHLKSKTKVGVVVWIDEGADVFTNVEHDTSGVKLDQQRALLVEMEQNNWRGMILVGVPGSGKSAIARAFGNEVGVPTLQVDFGDMEGSLVGESEAHLRQALRVIKSVGDGNAFFILTCNSLKGIRPQFMRRFKRGTFFFDLPTKDEKEEIWKLYEKKYELVGQKRPDDDAWTGAEIRECCESAWDTSKTMIDASRYIIPVAQSRATEIDEMRREANGRFLDASDEGAYQYKPEVMEKRRRSILLAKEPQGTM